MEKIKVLYIVGEGRSGSTLLERIVGQHSGVFAAGELRNIWDRSFLDDQLCSCGAHFSQCNLWKDVSNDWLLKNTSVERVVEAKSRMGRMRHFRMLSKKYGDITYNADLEVLVTAYYELYRLIQKKVGCEYVLDASKHPVFAMMLSMHPGIDMTILHLVRDVRGVAYSWMKKKHRPEITDRKELMPRYSITRSVMSWLVVNMVSERLNTYIDDYFVVRYEDVVSSPRLEVAKIFEWLGVYDETELFFSGENVVNLKKNHTVSGNPMRFTTGDIVLALDNEWMSEMMAVSKKYIELLSRRLLKKYRYL